jgi:hypothetical protein
MTVWMNEKPQIADADFEARCKELIALDKPTVPDVLPLVRDFYRRDGNGCGGNLHIVLDDTNVDDSHVMFCIERTLENRDDCGFWLATLLYKMSKTQRTKLSRNR